MSDSGRGWTSSRLPVVDENDDRYWSVSQAAGYLTQGRHLSEMEWRQLVRLAGLTPAGKRRNGARRRHVRVFKVADLTRLYENLETTQRWVHETREGA